MPSCVVNGIADTACDESAGGHHVGMATQLGRATCLSHLGHAASKKRGRTCSTLFNLNNIGRLSRVTDPTLRRMLATGKCRKRWPSDAAFGWKVPNLGDSEEAVRNALLPADADLDQSSFLIVDYEDASDDEDGHSCMLVLWRAERPPVLRGVQPAPAWAENGVVLSVDGDANRLQCHGPVVPQDLRLAKQKT
jgi:hypothetical protein